MYTINLKEEKVLEIAVYVENYQKKNVFLFMNQRDGSFALNEMLGKGRLELIDKDSASVFDISTDSYLIHDLLDALGHVHSDTVALMKRYFKSGQSANPTSQS